MLLESQREPGVAIFQSLGLDSNKASALAGVSAPPPLFSTSMCQENVMSASRVTEHLENNVRIEEDGPQRASKTEI